ncbi:hypothetical protein K0M31_008966 [Melipona bicolor]|uniref:Uncharacterized protein n=1 Tax=Melipona bicolor TaxID=60889 RepID=A0AA40FQ73_9HYME|nr:hypothetical protein K0M31_008966 [Melipona bicolor]
MKHFQIGGLEGATQGSLVTSFTRYHSPSVQESFRDTMPTSLGAGPSGQITGLRAFSRPTSP